MRCFNIDDKLLRLSINSNNAEYVLKNNLQQTLINKNCLNLNEQQNIGGVVYQASADAYSDAGEELYTRGFLSGSNDHEERLGFTMETNIIFPHYMKNNDKIARDFNTVSLFGAVMVDTGSTNSKTGQDTATLSYDKANFQVLAVRDSQFSKNIHF